MARIAALSGRLVLQSWPPRLLRLPCSASTRCRGRSYAEADFCCRRQPVWLRHAARPPVPTLAPSIPGGWWRSLRYLVWSVPGGGARRHTKCAGTRQSDIDGHTRRNVPCFGRVVGRSRHSSNLLVNGCVGGHCHGGHATCRAFLYCAQAARQPRNGAVRVSRLCDPLTASTGVNRRNGMAARRNYGRAHALVDAAVLRQI